MYLRYLPIVRDQNGSKVFGNVNAALVAWIWQVWHEIKLILVTATGHVDCKIVVTQAGQGWISLQQIVQVNNEAVSVTSHDVIGNRVLRRRYLKIKQLTESILSWTSFCVIGTVLTKMGRQIGIHILEKFSQILVRSLSKSRVIHLTNSSFKSDKIEVPSDMRDCWLGSTKGSLGFYKKKGENLDGVTLNIQMSCFFKKKTAVAIQMYVNVMCMHHIVFKVHCNCMVSCFKNKFLSLLTKRKKLRYLHIFIMHIGNSKLSTFP